ncbi:DUF3226 domain-containing protein [Sulfidibacter corallicola]|uniref:Uncharacterized protein n=1 Tax=Sulfidibacter corallicola TaxID=2818388 RepID=A0A8A4TUD2_SULCO|nr:DUF3226 domain-containing protein [Sulfidibacter corallicola]QTD52642.1 hypothetical protein J3U87_09220 [Sulfidibacter corallicola]
MTKKAVLLVEGQGDVLFFQALLRREGLLDVVDIEPPRSFGFPSDSVSLFPKLIEILVGKRMSTGNLDYLGVVADADHTSGGGVDSRWSAITEALKKQRYRIPKNMPKLANTGSIFKNTDGLPPVGLWLMPNHANNGMLEDLILGAADRENPEQSSLLNYADRVVTDLPTRLFGSTHESKAKTYSWLAWQKRPGQTLDVAINGELLDAENTSLKGLVAWLHQVFPGLSRNKRP